MRKILIAFLLISSFQIVSAQDTELTTFILVRHAEKAKDDPRNPNLSEIGLERAENLKKVLGNTDITAIFSTPYKRTQQTVAPLAEAKDLEVLSYNPGKMGDFFTLLWNEYRGGTILISGHSNTTPMLVNNLLGRESFKMLDENEYDKIFIVTSETLGKSKVTVISY